MISGGCFIGSSAGITGGGVSGGDCGSIVSGSGISGLVAMLVLFTEKRSVKPGRSRQRRTNSGVIATNAGALFRIDR